MKKIVIYYSYGNHTRMIAEKIKNNLTCDILEIKPKVPYSSDYQTVVDETEDNLQIRETSEIEDINVNIPLYDTVILGTPVWWGIAAWPVDTFVKNNNFDGKTVIPFCTSASSGLGESGQLLAKEAGTGNWVEGHRFSSNPSSSDIKSFTDSLK